MVGEFDITKAEPDEQVLKINRIITHPKVNIHLHQQVCFRSDSPLKCGASLCTPITVWKSLLGLQLQWHREQAGEVSWGFVPLTKSSVWLPFLRAFTNDLTLTTSAPENRCILKDLEMLITWVFMSFVPVKSRSLVWKNERSSSFALHLAAPRYNQSQRNQWWA